MDDIWIEIARTGSFTDNRGQEHVFTTARLDEIAANYNRRKAGAMPEDAPLVFGHPEDNQPAYGWASALKRQGQKLFAQFSQVPDSVREAVRQRRYKYVSMSLHPGNRHLRHVGLLGAAAPAIKGLAPVEMSGSGETTINFAASGLAAANGERADEAAKQNEQQGAKCMEDQKRLGQLEEQVKTLMEQVKTLTLERDKAARSAEENAKKLAEAGQAADAAGKEAVAVKAEFSAYRGNVEKGARAARLEKLVAEGRITPGEKADTLAQAEALAQIPQPMEFSDGEKASPEERFWRSLEARNVSPLLGTARPPADFSQGQAKDEATLDYSKKI
jgi:hypothetical protein